jgi:nucleotide-binding universal stress UspA family protein
MGSVAEGVLRSTTLPVFIVREEASIAPLRQGLLVPVDGSDSSRAALDAAIALALSSGAPITVCHVVDLGRAGILSGGQAQLVAGSIEILQAEGRRILADAAERAGSRVKLSSRCVDGMPVDEIERVALEIVPALIVMGSHGRTGLERLVMGSVAEGVVRRAPAPVKIVPLPRSHSGREVAGMA